MMAATEDRLGRIDGKLDKLTDELSDFRSDFSAHMAREEALIEKHEERDEARFGLIDYKLQIASEERSAVINRERNALENRLQSNKKTWWVVLAFVLSIAGTVVSTALVSSCMSPKNGQSQSK